MATTSSADPAGGWPLRFALLDTMGPRIRCRSAYDSVSFGQRSAIVPPAPRTRAGTISAATKMSDSGPGQNCCMSRRATGPTESASPWAWLGSGISEMNACSRARRFSRPTISTAATSSSEQPRPYTVSVGNAITPPRSTASAAASSTRRSGFAESTFITSTGGSFRRES